MGRTSLYFLRPLNQVDKLASVDELRKYLTKLDKRQKEPDQNIDEYFSEYSWSGGFIRVQKPVVRPAPNLEENDPKTEKIAEIVASTRGGALINLSNSVSVKN